MEKRNFSITFFILLFISLLIFLLSASGFLRPITDSLYKIAEPLRSVLRISTTQNNSEFLAKMGKLSDQTKLNNEVKALRDQFDSGSLPANVLLPARVIGAPGFIPGVSVPQIFIIDKGTEDGVKKGMAAVLNNNLVGVVVEVGAGFSKINLVTNDSFSTTAQVAGALGVVKGAGGQELLLGNVALSQTLEKNSIVYTKGSVGEDGLGVPSDLIIGRIVSVDKKASDLFQKANLRSALDFQRINYIFLVLR